ncbi:hypothetical protein ARNL5_03652 [Anaerolineae bacterium]|nr:hypothetical protein ARNL5_03652 [Anaerolineae bacterium]
MNSWLDPKAAKAMRDAEYEKQMRALLQPHMTYYKEQQAVMDSAAFTEFSRTVVYSFLVDIASTVAPEAKHELEFSCVERGTRDSAGLEQAPIFDFAAWFSYFATGRDKPHTSTFLGKAYSESDQFYLSYVLSWSLKLAHARLSLSFGYTSRSFDSVGSHFAFEVPEYSESDRKWVMKNILLAVGSNHSRNSGTDYSNWLFNEVNVGIEDAKTGIQSYIARGAFTWRTVRRWFGHKAYVVSVPDYQYLGRSKDYIIAYS